MKWMRFEHNGQRLYGVVDGETITVTDASWEEILSGDADVSGHAQLALADVRPLNPVAHTRKIIAIGLNYMDHIRETNSTPPENPLIFTKFTSSMTDPGAAITWSNQVTSMVDYEAELAVIIGRKANNVLQEDALSYVAGYTCANDVSARDLQFSDGQWIRGKSLDTFCPLGPVMVTADEIADPQALSIRCELNGKMMQDSNTSEMLFGVAELIAYCSRSFTLDVGDVLLTGTPHGVGIGRDPKISMADGDVVAVEIDGIGRLVNHCRVTG